MTVKRNSKATASKATAKGKSKSKRRARPKPKDQPKAAVDFKTRFFYVKEIGVTRFRCYLDLTQKQLAAEVKTSAAAVSRYERGIAINVDVIARIVQRLTRDYTEAELDDLRKKFR